MDVGKFLELQGAFQCQGPGKNRARDRKILQVAYFTASSWARTRISGRISSSRGRQITQNRDLFPRFPLLHAALAQSPGNRHQGQGQHLAGHGLGGGHADFRASLGKDHRARFPRY